MDDLENLMYKSWFTFIKKALPSENPRLFNTGFVAPQGPYVTVNFNSFEPVSSYTLYQSHADDITGLQKYFSTYTCFLTLRFYGDNAMSRAQSVVAALREPSTKQMLRDGGVAFRRSAPVRDASRAIDRESIEKIATVSIEYYFTYGGTDRGDDVSVIETVTVEDDPSQIYRNWNNTP